MSNHTNITDTNPGRGSEEQKGTSSAVIILGGLVFLGVIVICIVLAILGRAVWMGRREDKATLAVALGIQGPRTMALYIGETGEDPFWLPAGIYYIEAVDQDGKVYDGWTEIVADHVDGGDNIDIGSRVRSGGRQDEIIAQQLHTLANFMITIEMAQLTYFEVASAGFNEPFSAAVGILEMPALDPFYARLQEIEDQEESVFAALSAVEARVVIDFGVLPVSSGGIGAKVILPQPQTELWENLVSFFSFKGEEDELARQEILSVSAAMTPFEKEEAFYWLSAQRIGGAQNYDEFLVKLQAGELEDITEIRSDLNTGGPYQGVYQTVHPDSNRPGGENIHRAGAEMIKRGAELEVDAVKEVLKNAFPGIEQGFAYADLANEWVNFVQNMYIDPLGAIKGWALDKIKGEIQEDLKLDLMHAIPDMNEADADYLADKLSSEIMKTHADVIAAASQAQSGVEATVSAARTATKQAMLPPGGDELPQVPEESDTAPQPSAELSTTLTLMAPTGEPSATMQAEPAPSVTPQPSPTITIQASTTPDAGWIDGFVQSITDQLLADEYDAIAIAVFSDDLQQCLHGEVANGASQQNAIAACGSLMSSIEGLKGDWVVRNFSGSLASSTCQGLDNSLNLSTWESDMILDGMAAFGVWVLDGDGGGMTWQQMQPFPEQAVSFTVSGYAAISEDQVKVTYSARVNNTTSSHLIEPLGRSSANSSGAGKFFALGMLVPAAGMIFTRKRAKRKSVLLLVLLGLVMLASLTACELEEFENLNVDAEFRGEYNFTKPDDLLLYFQMQSGSQEIWNLGPGSGSLVLDIDLKTEDESKQCISTFSASGTGIILADGVVTPADIKIGE